MFVIVWIFAFRLVGGLGRLRHLLVVFGIDGSGTLLVVLLFVFV